MTQKENGQAEQAPLSTPEEARQLLAEDRARRLQECNAEIAQVLERHKCRLVAIPQWIERDKGWTVTAIVQIREVE